MIYAYLANNQFLPQAIGTDNQALLKDALWIDLLIPTKEEQTLVNQVLNLDMPTREEMQEIELSSRLYKDQDSLFMTATLLAQSESPDPKTDAVTFILTKQQLLTVRYIEPQSFKFFISQIQKTHSTYDNAGTFLIDLLDATIDRLADILEIVSHRLDDFSRTIFRKQSMSKTNPKLNYQQLLLQIGADGDLSTKTRESLVALNRLITYFGQNAETQLNETNQAHLLLLSKDVIALSDHVTFLSGKINFLLDATLGMVNIEQTNIIKILSVAATIFLPPTLIATIYGMNFKDMPELSWHGGYLFSLIAMFLSAWLPYKYFKYKKWL